jgi:AcrR family transcriptional regulator
MHLIPLPATTTARERLLAAAEQLIYRGGIHATGIDAIVRASGTARKSIYSHFASKDELVTAALEQRHLRWLDWFCSAVEAHADSAHGRLLAVFEVLRGWFGSDGFHGCAFLNAAGEIGDPDDPARRVARAHKAELLAYLTTLTDAYGRPRGASPEQISALARQWLVLIDGAIGVALVSGNPDAALDACAIGLSLLGNTAEASPTAGPVSDIPRNSNSH